MSREPPTLSSLERFARFVGGEIRPYPGRMNVTLRCVLGSALVIITSMALQVPLLALSLIVVFFVTQANVVMTRLVGALFIVGSTLAIAIAMLLLKFTYDYPLLRILLAGTLFFFSVYMMRVTKIGVVFFIVGIVVIYVQTFVDQIDQPDLLVRALLWVWVAVNYAIALTLVINTLFLPAEPVHQLDAAIRAQLDAVDARLTALEQRTSSASTLAARDVEAGVLTLQKLLRFATMRDDAYRANQAFYLARVATVSRLYAAASHLPASTAGISPETLAAVRDGCRQLGESIRTGTQFVAPNALAALPAGGLPGALVEMRDALLAFSDRSAAPPTRESSVEKAKPLVPDALTNPVYMQFALKTLLATLLSYVFYTATDWQGIHTIMLSCLIVAQPSLGATTQRAVLRLGGVGVGSVLALAMVVWVVPRIDGIVGLLLMSLPVIALGAWLAAGSERISYAGTQIMFTFSLALLEHFGPSANLTEIRDRMIGVFLGVIISTIVHAYVWPEAEGEALRQRIARLLHGIAGQLRSGVSGPAPVSLWAGLGDAEAMSARVALEPGWQMAEGQKEGFMLDMQSLLAQIREILLASDAFGAERRALSLTPRTETEAIAFQTGLATSLDDYAHALAVHPLAVDAPRQAALDALTASCLDDLRDPDLRDPSTDVRQAAYGRFLARAGNLASHISGLPARTADHANSAFLSRASQA